MGCSQELQKDQAAAEGPAAPNQTPSWGPAHPSRLQGSEEQLPLFSPQHNQHRFNPS